VKVPPRGAFTSPEVFYEILFREMGHATGHQLRLSQSDDPALSCDFLINFFLQMFLSEPPMSRWPR